MAENSLIAVDLFSGMGGLSLGLHRAGFNVVAAVEYETLAAATYAINHPVTRLLQRDVWTLSPRAFRQSLGMVKGELDLLAGCPPCQGFSSMRTLNGAKTIADERNDLVEAFGDFVAEFRPKAVLMENVPGLIGDRRLIHLCEHLRALGYFEPSVGVLDAADYGVPQRRKRALLMASRVGMVDFPVAARARKTVRHTISTLPVPGQSGDPAHDRLPRHSPVVSEIIRSIPHDGGSRLDLGMERQLPCHKRSGGFKDVYGRMSWDDVSPTITSGCVNPSKGRFIHPDQDRAITIREASLLQTFPRRYSVPMARGLNPAAVLIGNAFPPEFARRQALQISKLLLHKRSRRNGG